MCLLFASVNVDDLNQYHLILNNAFDDAASAGADAGGAAVVDGNAHNKQRRKEKKEKPLIKCTRTRTHRTDKHNSKIL